MLLSSLPECGLYTLAMVENVFWEKTSDKVL